MTAYRFRNAALLALLAAGMIWATLPRSEAAAGMTPPFHDQDQDLLPDAVERMLLTDPGRTDSDGDGIGDFLDAVQHAQITPNLPKILDHEMRVVVTIERTGDGQRHVVANFLLRLAGQPRVHVIAPFLHMSGGLDVPIAPLLGSTGLSHTRQRHDPLHGTLLIAAARLCSVNELHRLLPCTIGVRALIDDRFIVRGTYLTSVEGVPVSLVPWTSGDFVLQTLSPDDPDDPFWQTSRACELTLQPQGYGSGGMICEIDSAECVGAPTLSCAPTCSAMAGGILIIPSGLGTLRGG
jgi:hypothetical protein